MNFEKNFGQIKSREELLGEFYDENDGKILRDKLSVEDYSKLRDNFIQDSIELEETNDMLEQRTYEAYFDEVTGLKNRRELFKKISKQMREVLGVDPDKEMNDADWIEIIKKETRDLSDENLYVMLSDISYLGLVNDTVSHESGDKLLKKVSHETKSVIGECFRHGGDEITASFKSGKETDPQEFRKALMEKAQKARKNVSEIESLSGMKGLKPNIDIGFANFQEALDIFRTLMNNGEFENMETDVVRKLQDIWLLLADKRLSISKAKERLSLLFTRQEHGEEIMDGLRKAAYNISDKELENLRSQIKNEADFHRVVGAFIKEREERKLDQAKSGEREEIKLVLEYLKII